MKGEIVPDSHHVSRLCGGSHVRSDGTIAPTAFRPRPGETYMSVNWLEHLGLPTRETEIAELRRVLAGKRAIGPTARLAVLNVGEARIVVLRGSPNRCVLTVLHEPELDPDRPMDISHSGIYGVPEDDIVVADLLASAVAEVHSAK